MKSSLNRIKTILFKDMREYWALIILVIIIPIIVFYLPTKQNGMDFKVGVIANNSINNILSENGLKSVSVDNMEQGLKILEDRKIDAFIDAVDKTVYINNSNPILTSKLKKALSDNEVTKMKISIVSQSKGQDSYIYLLCSIIVLMVGLIAGPIIFLAEKDSNVMSCLMISPMTYSEFILSKTIVLYLCSAISLFSFMALVSQLTNVVQLLIMICISSLVISLFIAIASTMFESAQQMMVYTSPVLIGLLLIEIFTYIGKLKLRLPIQLGFKKILVDNILPVNELLILSLASILGFFLYIFITRKISRMHDF